MKAIYRQLQQALDEEDVTQAKVYLYYHKSKINLDKKDPVNCGKTLLHCFCEKGSLSVVRLLVNHGASIELADDNGNTSLHYACLGNHFELARFLLNTCADVFATNNLGKTPSEMTTDSSIKILLEMAMSLKSGTNQIMTLGRMRKPKNNNQQTSLRRRASSKRGQNDFKQNTDVEATKASITTTKVKKNPSFGKKRRSSVGSIGLSRIKNSLTVGKESPRRHHIDAKWSDLQALQRSTSETSLNQQNDETSSIDVIVDDDVNDENVQKIQKVNNSDQINLIGLTIT